MFLIEKKDREYLNSKLISGLVIENGESLYDFILDIKEKMIYRPKGVCFISGLSNENKNFLTAKGVKLTNKLENADFGIVPQGILFSDKTKERVYWRKENDKLVEKRGVTFHCSEKTVQQLKTVMALPKLINLENLMNYHKNRNLSIEESNSIANMLKSNDHQTKEIAFKLIQNINPNVNGSKYDQLLRLCSSTFKTLKEEDLSLRNISRNKGFYFSGSSLNEKRIFLSTDSTFSNDLKIYF